MELSYWKEDYEWVMCDCCEGVFHYIPIVEEYEWDEVSEL